MVLQCLLSLVNALSIMHIVPGADPGGGDWGDRPPKTYESNFIHHNFVHFGKQR